jgi:hypothetical protein
MEPERYFGDLLHLLRIGPRILSPKHYRALWHCTLSASAGKGVHPYAFAQSRASAD